MYPFIGIAVCTIIAMLLVAQDTSLSSSTPTSTSLHKYILLTVDKRSNKPVTIILFHNNHRALHKSLKEPHSKWKLCSYTWTSTTRTLRYQTSDTRLHSLRLQPIRNNSSPAYISYQPNHTVYVWKPLPNTFACRALVGETIPIPIQQSNTAHSTPFDAVRVHTRKRARVRLLANQQWLECNLTCRKAKGNAVRRFDAFLYIKPVEPSQGVPFRTAVLRWCGGRVVRVEWLDGRGVRWVEACGGK